MAVQNYFQYEYMRDLIRRRRQEQIKQDMACLERPFGIQIVTPRELLIRLR